MVNYKDLGLVNTREMFARAIKGGYAIPAFNFNNMEQMQAIIKAAVETKSPVILQVSKGARQYANATLLRYMAQGAVEYAKELGCKHPKDVQQIFAVISSRFPQATVFVETMNPTMVRHFKEKSIDASNAKFNWGIKNGKALAELLPEFRFVEEHSLTEGMAAFAPIYKLLDRLPAVRNISNKIIVLEKE